jgi:hypothetical protein
MGLGTGGTMAGGVGLVMLVLVCTVVEEVLEERLEEELKEGMVPVSLAMLHLDSNWWGLIL